MLQEISITASSHDRLLPQRTETLESLAGDVRLIIDTTRMIMVDDDGNLNSPTLDPHRMIAMSRALNIYDEGVQPHSAAMAIHDPSNNSLLQPVDEISLIKLAGLQRGKVLDYKACQDIHAEIDDQIRISPGYGNPKNDEIQILGMMRNLRLIAHKLSNLVGQDITLPDILRIPNPELNIGIDDNLEEMRARQGSERVNQVRTEDVLANLQARLHVNLNDPMTRQIYRIIKHELTLRNNEYVVPQQEGDNAIELLEDAA